MVLSFVIRLLLVINVAFCAVIHYYNPAADRQHNIRKRSLPTLGMTCKGRRQARFYADVHAGCEFFYVCDHDNQMHFIQCPPGTIFAEELQICNFPGYVQCTSAIINQEVKIYGRKNNHRSHLPRPTNIPVLNTTRPILGKLPLHRVPTSRIVPPHPSTATTSPPVARRFPDVQTGRLYPNPNERDLNNPTSIHSFEERRGSHGSSNNRRPFNVDAEEGHSQRDPSSEVNSKPTSLSTRRQSLEEERSTTTSTTPRPRSSQFSISYFTRAPPTRAHGYDRTQGSTKSTEEQHVPDEVTSLPLLPDSYVFPVRPLVVPAADQPDQLPQESVQSNIFNTVHPEKSHPTIRPQRITTAAQTPELDVESGKTEAPVSGETRQQKSAPEASVTPPLPTTSTPAPITNNHRTEETEEKSKEVVTHEVVDSGHDASKKESHPVEEDVQDVPDTNEQYPVESLPESMVPVDDELVEAGLFDAADTDEAPRSEYGL